MGGNYISKTFGGLVHWFGIGLSIVGWLLLIAVLIGWLRGYMFILGTV